MLGIKTKMAVKDGDLYFNLCRFNQTLILDDKYFLFIYSFERNLSALIGRNYFNPSLPELFFFFNKHELKTNEHNIY